MTPEEAAEIVLDRVPTITCGVCKGSGGPGYVDIEQGQYSPPIRCSACAGMGRLLRAQYLQACQMLGRPLPPHFNRLVSEPSCPSKT